MSETNGKSAAGGPVALSDEQQAAVDLCCTSRFSVMVGGPGTGKSTTARAIYQRLGGAAGGVVACSPTGKAAKRLSQCIGGPAGTIHRALKYDPSIGGFMHHGGNPLPCGAVLLDEASMCDTSLFAALLDAVPRAARVVVVGDADQLPSVGPGAVLRDLVDSGAAPLARLTRVYRQDPRSRIAVNCQAIQAGLEPELEDAADCAMVEVGDDALADQVVEIVARQDQYDPLEVQVITPQNKGPAGVEVLNQRLQAELNPDRGQPSVELGATAIRAGDRVTQRSNNYDVESEGGGAPGVYNGETGRVLDIDGDGRDWRMRVDYGDRVARYTREQVGGISLAYAVTVHKCVAPDTLVETEWGLIPIEELPGAGTIAGVRQPVKFQNKVENSSGRAREVVTRGGYRITTTPDHGIDRWDGKKFSRAAVGELRPGDVLRLRLGVTVEPRESALLPFPPRGLDVRARMWRIPDGMTPELAEFFGLMVADGTVFRRGFRLVKRHRDVCERFAQLCAFLFGVRGEIVRRRDCKAWEVTIGSVAISVWLTEVGGMNPRDKRTPACVLRSPSQIHAAFLRGLFEDGYAGLKKSAQGTKLDHVEFGCKSRVLEQEVRVMLLRLGIVTGTTNGPICKVEIYGANARRFFSRVGFVASKKNARGAHNVGNETRYTIPLSESEIAMIKSGMSASDYGNARNRRTISRHLAEKLIAKFNQDARALMLMEKMEFHYEQVRAVNVTLSPTMCVEVPDGHQFLQNGFAGWNCQGSEFKAAAVVASPLHRRMWSRQLLYTAMSRPKQFVWVVGDRAVLTAAVRNTTPHERRTGLRDRLRAATPAR